MNRELVPVVLDGVPADLLGEAVSYLADVLRECHLAVIDHGQGGVVDDELLGLASALMPDLEELREISRSSTVVPVGATVTVQAELRLSDAALLADLQTQLIQLRLLGRRGFLLVVSDPRITRFLAWIWDEAADQLHGRTARPYPA